MIQIQQWHEQEVHDEMIEVGQVAQRMATEDANETDQLGNACGLCNM